MKTVIIHPASKFSKREVLRKTIRNLDHVRPALFIFGQTRKYRSTERALGDNIQRMNL